MEDDDQLEHADGGDEDQDRDVQPIDATAASWLVSTPFMMMVFTLSGLWALGGISAELWASLVAALIVVGWTVARTYRRPVRRDDERRLALSGAQLPRARMVSATWMLEEILGRGWSQRTCSRTAGTVQSAGPRLLDQRP